eukprot:1001229-Karenia_brevis.AAC.1
MCGALLHGDAIHHSFGNKASGPPINRDGEQVSWPTASTEPEDAASVVETSTILEHPDGQPFYGHGLGGGGRARRQAYMDQ